jgi:hypothetical protein
MWREAKYFGRMAGGWFDLLRAPAERDPEALVRKNLQTREANFLNIVRRVISAEDSNPLNMIFRWAGCDYEDVEKGVKSDGLEATLESLRRAGVYVSHDEFKGRKPIRRSGHELAASPGDFKNPLVRSGLETTSSGSRSTGTITRPSLEFQLYREGQDALFLKQFLSPPRVVGALLPILPSTVALHRMLACIRLGVPVERWFALAGSLRDSGHYQIMTRLLVLESRMMGVKMQYPKTLPQNDFTPVARWIAQRKAQGTEILFITPVSFAVRVVAAAADCGADIRGTIFLSGAEPLTTAKRAVIEGGGAAVFSRYGISELGWIGWACRQMTEQNCVHVMRDAVAVISHRRRPELADIEVDSLLFTPLLPFSSYVLINVEMDDSGILEPARCGCPLKEMGFTQQIRDIYSFGKLTGQGITLVGADVLNILEKSLPARFGGTPADYQLVEREGASQTETELRISPRVGASSVEEVRNFFLAEIKRLWGGSLTYRLWSQTDGIRVVFAEPIISGNRKINPLHLLGSDRENNHAT